MISGQPVSGTSPEPSEAEGDEASRRAQRLLEKQRKKEEADAARRAAEERMKASSYCKTLKTKLMIS